MKGIKIKIDNFMFAIHYPHIPHSKHAFDYSKKKKKSMHLIIILLRPSFIGGVSQFLTSSFRVPTSNVLLPCLCKQPKMWNTIIHIMNKMLFSLLNL